MQTREKQTKAYTRLIDFVNLYKSNLSRMRDRPSNVIFDKIEIIARFSYSYRSLRADLNTRRERFTSGRAALLALSKIKDSKKSQPSIDMDFLQKNRGQWRHLFEEQRSAMREFLIAFCEKELAGKIIDSKPKEK